MFALSDEIFVRNDSWIHDSDSRALNIISLNYDKNLDLYAIVIHVSHREIYEIFPQNFVGVITYRIYLHNIL